ncbi:MAG: hypothetical protein HKN71_08570 [Gemmatimonadetes bacterium]|nr:hypothetical protein [Gemmatimonadota bacterium]
MGRGRVRQQGPLRQGSGGVVRLAGILTAALLVGTGTAAAQDWPVSDALPAEARQFDFWVGEWDVDLRIRQDDFSWSDEVRSVASVYPILRGKAVLELWSDVREGGIKGYSLRYFDTARDEWVLWLNWPGPDVSGSSSLAGTFRHGRGEFFSRNDASVSRYTFSDIGPNSLRWDDAFSQDGGATWSNRWIMEFTRRADRAWLVDGEPAPTFHTGERCSAAPFRSYDFLAGRQEGQVEVGGSGPVTIMGHRVLDGCAVLTFAGAAGGPETAYAFSHWTWNTYAERFELTTLTSGANTPVRMFFGTPGASGEADLVLVEQVDGSRAADRFRVERADDGRVTWVHETPDGEGWRAVWRATVRPVEGR